MIASYILLSVMAVLGLILAMKERKRFMGGERNPSGWIYMSIICMACSMAQGFDTFLPRLAHLIIISIESIGTTQKLTDALVLISFWILGMGWCFMFPVGVAKGWEGLKDEF